MMLFRHGPVRVFVGERQMTTARGISRTTFLSYIRAAAIGLMSMSFMTKIAAAAEDMLLGVFTGFKSKDRARRVQELMDREEILELSARYAQRILRRLDVVDLFTDDGVFIVRLPDKPPQESRGREQLEKTYAAILARPERPMPKLHNVLIDVNGDTATARVWVEVHVPSADGQRFVSGGYYQDQMRRENGRWKFAVRDVTTLVGATHSTSTAPPASTPN
jgi:hypothetical protein